MGPDNDPNSILRKTPGLSNLFHTNIRRSRSLASLQREAAEQQQPSMWSRTPLGAYNSFNEGSNGSRTPLRPNRTTNSPSPNPGANQPWFANPSLTQPPYARTPSPPTRPKPAPRLWTEDDDEPDIKPSLLGSQQPMQGPLIIRQTPPMTPPKGYQRDPRTQSPRTMALQSQRERSLSRRRQQSVQDLNLGDPLSTVAEWIHESPSFPTRPRSSRNMSDPITPGRPRESLTPRAQSTDDTARTPQADQLYANKSTPGKRASSMLLPIALAPLIASSPPQMTKYDLFSPEGFKPPVPPKDSIYQTNAVPTHRPGQGSTSTTSSVSHSAQSSFSELDYTVSSSVTTMSPIDLPNTWPVELPGVKEPVSPKTLGQDESQDPSGKLPWVMKEYKAVPARKPVAANEDKAATDTTTPPQLPKIPLEHARTMDVVPTLKTPNPDSLHQRNTSDSVLNRGRPTRRGTQHRPQRTISRDLRLANIAGTINDLPEGYNKVQALTTFDQVQLAEMRREADCDASGFDVLDMNDVTDLKKEVELLDTHCGELRRRTLSLRETRQQLHERLLQFLKVPGNPLVSREHVLKQDAELSTLDAKIDEASTKLEAAQDRRVKVQRKLLEHAAAMLALKIPGLGNSGIADEQTPPRSPERAPGFREPSSIMIAMDADELDLSPPKGPLTAEPRTAQPASAASVYSTSLEEQAAAANKVEEDERAYLERIQRAREAEERREQEQRQDAERQQKALEQELLRQQEERDAEAKKASPKANGPKKSNSKKSSPKEVSPKHFGPKKVSLKKVSLRKSSSTKSSPKRASSKQESPTLAPAATLQLLSQERYDPSSCEPSPQQEDAPTRAASVKREATPLARPAAPVSEEAPSTPKATPKEEKSSPRQEVVQSIQVYAGDDLYSANNARYSTHQDGMDSLLSSIEQEIDAMEGQRATMVY